MRLPVVTTIDTEACIGCGRCVEVCPSDTLEMRGDVAVVTGDHSMQCGHCVAVCPVDAVEVGGLVCRVPEAAASIDPSALWRLMGMRRSTRCYTDEPVAIDVLEDLIQIATTAPTATNCQPWSFTLLPDRAAVMAMGQAMADFYRRIETLSRSRVARAWARVFHGDALGEFHRRYADAVRQALDEWDSGTRERLFHGATAAMVISTHPPASDPEADALMAAQNVLLAAEAMGLGTCMIGFAVQAMRRDRSIARLVGIPDEEEVQAVIGIGHPAVTYQRPAGRWPVAPRVYRGVGR